METYVQVNAYDRDSRGRIKMSDILPYEPVCPNGTDRWSISTNMGTIGDFDSREAAQAWMDWRFPLEDLHTSALGPGPAMGQGSTS